MIDDQVGGDELAAELERTRNGTTLAALELVDGGLERALGVAAVVGLGVLARELEGHLLADDGRDGLAGRRGVVEGALLVVFQLVLARDAHVVAVATEQHDAVARNPPADGALGQLLHELGHLGRGDGRGDDGPLHLAGEGRVARREPEQLPSPVRPRNSAVARARILWEQAMSEGTPLPIVYIC